MRLQAIVPKQYTSSKRGREGLDRYLKSFAQEVMRDMQDYPQWRPWKNPPKTGPRAGGKRLGNYGRSWFTRGPSGFAIEIVNNVEYAVYVGGPKKGAKGQRQAAHMHARGWTSVSDVAPRAAKRIGLKARIY